MIALQPALKFNGGGHLNHAMFWQMLVPPRDYEPPSGRLEQARCRGGLGGRLPACLPGRPAGRRLRLVERCCRAAPGLRAACAHPEVCRLPQRTSPHAGILWPAGQLKRTLIPRAQAIEAEFGALDALTQQFNAATAGVQGSGWGWLAYDPQVKNLVIRELRCAHTSSLVEACWQSARMGHACMPSAWPRPGLPLRRTP